MVVLLSCKIFKVAVTVILLEESSANVDVDVANGYGWYWSVLSDDPPTAIAAPTPKSPRPIFPFELDFLISFNDFPEARLNAI